MNMDDLIEQLDETLDGGFKMPGKRVVVDVEKVRAIVDDMRMTMPTEIKQAKAIVNDRAEIWSAETWNAREEEEMTPEKMKACLAALGF